MKSEEGNTRRAKSNIKSVVRNKKITYRSSFIICIIFIKKASIINCFEIRRELWVYLHYSCNLELNFSWKHLSYKSVRNVLFLTRTSADINRSYNRILKSGNRVPVNKLFFQEKLNCRTLFVGLFFKVWILPDSHNSHDD